MRPLATAAMASSRHTTNASAQSLCRAVCALCRCAHTAAAAPPTRSGARSWSMGFAGGFSRTTTTPLSIAAGANHTDTRRLSTSLPMRGSAVGAAVRKPTGPQTARKAALTLTPVAVARLRELTSDPSGPKMLKVGTKKKGCSGQVYTLEYVTERSRFDEVVEQDGVKVIIESRALLSLLGSEMDYVESKLSSQFVFINPNVKEMCGCGMSFMT